MTWHIAFPRRVYTDWRVYNDFRRIGKPNPGVVEYPFINRAHSVQLELHHFCPPRSL